MTGAWDDPAVRAAVAQVTGGRILALRTRNGELAGVSFVLSDELAGALSLQVAEAVAMGDSVHAAAVRALRDHGLDPLLFCWDVDWM